MDTLASLALATEPPNESILLRPPHSRFDYIISKKMFKHIFGQSIFQFIVLMILVFDGENFIPESADSFDAYIQQQLNSGGTYKDDSLPKSQQTVKIDFSAKYSDTITRTHIRSGRIYQMNGVDNDYSKNSIYKFGPSRHFTFIFNTFVMMQIFNFLNCRKLKDEWNTFENISKSGIFMSIIALILFL